MLSRVAENIYWMARYVERAENIARLMDVNNHLQLDMPEAGTQQWEPLISIMADEENFYKNHETATQETVTHFMACDADNPNSIVSCLRMAREDARSIREILPCDMWLQVNTLYLRVKQAAEAGPEAITPQLLADVRLGSHLFFGLMTDIMARGEAYAFAQLGRFIERADKSSRVIDVKYFLLLPSPSDVGSPLDNIQWMAVLKSVSAYEMFRKRKAAIDPASVVQFLLRDEDFPRSVSYCLCTIGMFLDRVAGSHARAEQIPACGRVQEILEQLRAQSADQIIIAGLHQQIDALQSSLNQLHNDIYEAFFSIKPTGRSQEQVQKME